MQAANDSRAAYARLEHGPLTHDSLGAKEAEFIAARDSFYMASVSDSGWPYVQHRGGPPGFLKVLGDREIGLADYSGNKQYISVGNAATDDRVALIMIDYHARRRLKLLARLSVVDLGTEPELAARLFDATYRATVERGLVLRIEAFDWNCPQHITPRFTEAEVLGAVAPLQARLAALEDENERLRRALDDKTEEV